ncbi:MAG: tetratricopeptide repeat protein [Acidobacteria bacterium]|nr:tetratricopeptide repeat protein [Acidobacteriota bacterium]MCA1649489.1 tetratricopeptide repeat protein [Acidobacteriota bacterium]
MENYGILLGALLALLAGLAIGKAWERYKLADGRWIDRRRARESPHYMLGLNFLVANQVDPAIAELTKAAETAGDPLEIHLILGNLYREKGQVGRAIQEHQKLLQRPNLRKLEHANVLLCLGLDYKHGGFVDRALEAFSEVLRLDPNNQYALANLEKLYEEQHQWGDAYATRQKLSKRDDAGADARHQEILAFLENEIGLEALKRMDYPEAARRFEAAIELDARNAPAYMNLGDVRFYLGDPAGSTAAWERLIEASPDRAYLAFSRLEAAYPKSDDAGRFPELCRRLIGGNPQDWRARLALARHLSARGAAREGLDLLFEALVQNPHALAVHQAIWQTLSALHLPQPLVDRYIDLARESVFYLDPHICVRCRYRSTELLWQCPHCHEWNTFLEERIAPAKDSEATIST